MRKAVIIIATVLFATAAWSQDTTEADYHPFTAPNYQQIKQDCNDKHSSRYYPKLAKRFAKLDTTLDFTDLLTFYYGQAYQEDYYPYDNPSEFDEIRGILNKDEVPTLEDVRKIVKLADAVIARKPAEIKAYYYKDVGQNIECKYYGGDTTELMKTVAQFSTLFDVITSTGNGITPELAIHVVSTSHEYLVMNMFGFSYTSQSLTQIDGHSYDMFTIDTNEYDVDNLYFNIDCIIGAWSKIFPSMNVDKKAPTTSIDLTLGTKFVIELKKAKRKNSTFILVEKEHIDDTITAEADSLFRDPVPENQIVGYFCPTRLYDGSDKVFNCLVFRSNCANGQLYYDTFISKDGVRFNTTSNRGILRGVRMNEMWHDDAQHIRISNIRTRK